MNPLTQSKNTTIRSLLIALELACFALSPTARAVCREGCDLLNGNTFLGNDALVNNTSDGVVNTAIGAFALESNITGGDNTATGINALVSNTAGLVNTANGSNALASNTTGQSNMATGGFSLFSNTTGNTNTATGVDTLSSNTTGEVNTATGASALSSNTTGHFNTATGWLALFSNTTGNANIALGYSAGVNLTTGSHNIYIGNAGSGGGESRRIRIGTAGVHTATFIAGTSGVTVPDGVGVIVGNNGKLGTVVSSARFKDQIKPMDKASEAILALKPVTFRYKPEFDPEGIAQFGLVAEDVEKVNRDLVARDAQGKPYTVRYEAVNAMLLNEFLKEHGKVESLEKQLKAAEAKQEEKISALTELVKAQGAQLQKVSAQLGAASPSGGGFEARKSLPQIVLNNQ